MLETLSLRQITLHAGGTPAQALHPARSVALCHQVEECVQGGLVFNCSRASSTLDAFARPGPRLATRSARGGMSGPPSRELPGHPALPFCDGKRCTFITLTFFAGSWPPPCKQQRSLHQPSIQGLYEPLQRVCQSMQSVFRSREPPPTASSSAEASRRRTPEARRSERSWKGGRGFRDLGI